MKSLKTLLTCGMLLVSTAAFAQFSNAGGSKSTSSRSGGLVKKTDSYSRIYVGYNPMTVSTDYEGVDDVTLHGVSFGYTRGISLSKSLPMFLEVGGKVAFNFKKDSDDDDYESIETKQKALSVSVPVNFTYKLSFGDGNISLSPFFGLTFKGNVLAKETEEVTYNHRTEKETYDYFDKDDVGKDGQWKRFQAGWQIGANLDIKQFSLGFHYGSDFNEICKKTTTSNWAVTLGYNF